MAVPADLTWVTMIADPNAPAGALAWDGRTVGLRPADLAQAGSGPDNPGYLLGQRGYFRADPADSTKTQWFMIPLLSDAARRAIRDIPGTHGWPDTTARDDYRSVVRNMIQAGVLEADALTYVTTLYNAATRNAAMPT